MNRKFEFLMGILLGAGLMYVLDPNRGRTRRALLRDQIVHSAHEIEEFGEAAVGRARHARNRARGVILQTRSRMRREMVDDSVVEARVRTHFGRIPIDTSDVTVSSEHGRVTLRGSAPESQIDALIEAVHDVPGVHDVINRLRTRRNA